MNHPRKGTHRLQGGEHDEQVDFEADRRANRRRSGVRHGQLMYEHATTSTVTTTTTTSTTIRTVTPDSSSSNGLDITALPSPSSFPAQNQSQHRLHDPTTSVSNTDEESAIDSRRRKVKKKLRQKSPAPIDTSPNSFFKKTRKRLNSITTQSSIPMRQEDPAMSIGFPSVVQASIFPDLQDLRSQLPKTPRRTYSSDATPTNATLSMRSPLILETDSEKILKLMKTLCGRMHGILFYRPTGTTSWHSGYCAINCASGSLVCQNKGDITSKEVLIPDLRGCNVRTHYDPAAQSAHLSVTLPVSAFGYQLRPSVPETFDSWLAALLCWQPLKPKGIYDKLAKPQPISISDKSNANNRRLSDINNSKSTAVIKSSQLLLWDRPLPAGSFRHEAKQPRLGSYSRSSWRRVNCTLHENGTLRLLAEDNAVPIRALKLNGLARCAIQRLHESVLGAKHCIAVYPYYSANSVPGYPSNPLVLSLGSRVAFEAWFVLLQAMTVPELYGPQVDLCQSHRSTPYREPDMSTSGMFRIERSLYIKITEAKFLGENTWQDQHDTSQPSRFQRPTQIPTTDLYADVLLGQDLRARTVGKPLSSSIFWADDFFLTDLPSMVSSVSIVLKTGTPDEREWTMTARDDDISHSDEATTDFGGIEVASHDPVYGRVDVALSELEQESYHEKWWPIIDGNGVRIGQALIKFNLEGNVVLMESEYSGLLKLLLNFDNSLTSQLGHLLGSELKRLSDIMLDIFQSADQAEDWINNLVEEDIDGIHREQPPTLRMRFSGRLHSNDSYETAEQRELLVRDLSRSATMEANLLFRGNSLVTKALDAHQRRIGKEYLEETLGDKLRAIAQANYSCEVDPDKVSSHEQLDRNWSNLITCTTSVWQAIAASASKCPLRIRQVLKHIASCAEDRYGSFIRTVKYTSVSSFLFLRLFCPCIMNPKLFGMMEDHPPERAKRAFTLIAKSLMALANLSKFGQKEPWLEPMNKFLTSATPEFKTFMDQICSWNPAQGKFYEPQYQAATQIKQRLPVVSREGLPSLPYLLDGPRSLANLVDMWLDNAPSDLLQADVDESVKAFHSHCLRLKQSVQDCMKNAEVAPEPNRDHERQWKRMLSENPRSRLVSNPFEQQYADTNITALPQAFESRPYEDRHHYIESDELIQEESESAVYENRARRFMTSTNSSNASLEALIDYRKRNESRNREGGRNRYLDVSNSRNTNSELSMNDLSNRI